MKRSTTLGLGVVVVTLTACATVSESSESGADGPESQDRTNDCEAKGAPEQPCSTPSSADSRTEAGAETPAPTPTDGIKNGDESDVDCGGTNAAAAKCALGRACKTHGDCVSDACSYGGKCVAVKSCTGHLGGDTCGAGEVGQPEAQHESCCTSIELPGRDLRLDKYQITAGRMRTFLERMNGNVRAFVQASPPQGWNRAWDEYVPNGWDTDPSLNDDNDPTFYRRARSSVWHQLGGSVLYAQVGGVGCHLAGTGAHTYWMDDAVQMEQLGDMPHAYPRDALDVKALQCATFLMVAAFCHWDGGFVPSIEDLDSAWGTTTYPWGKTPPPQGGNGAPATGDPNRANYAYNYSVPSLRIDPDFTANVSAPGRFPTGNGRYGHADLAGNVFEVTRPSPTTAGQPNPTVRVTRWSRNGSWEGHAIPYQAFSSPLLRKYGKQGGRCARPL